MYGLDVSALGDLGSTYDERGYDIDDCSTLDSVLTNADLLFNLLTEVLDYIADGVPLYPDEDIYAEFLYIVFYDTNQIADAEYDHVAIVYAIFVNDDGYEIPYVLDKGGSYDYLHPYTQVSDPSDVNKIVIVHVVLP